MCTVCLGTFECTQGSFLQLCSLKFLQWWDIVEKSSPRHLSRKLLPGGDLTNDCIVGLVCTASFAQHIYVRFCCVVLFLFGGLQL